MNSKSRPKVRASALNCFEKTITAMIGYNPQYKSIFLPSLPTITNYIFTSFSDESSIVQKVLWKSVFKNFSELYRNELWENVDVKKAFFPHFLKSV